jgi:hypothetical protein
MRKTIALILTTTFLPQFSLAEEIKSKHFEHLDFKPVVLDSEKSESSTLGLEFLVSGKLTEKKFSRDEQGLGIDPDAPVGGLDASYSLRGTITENSANNPNNFVETNLSANYFRSSKFTAKAGAFIKSESDQRFDNNQAVYGLTATMANDDSLADNNIFALHANLGIVDPSEDIEREAILGSTGLDTYERLDVEALYIFNIGTNSLNTFEVNFRYFYELGADTAIKDADLDNFRLVTYRLGFKNNLFIAYSSGELPFDQKDNQIYSLGFNYKFE